MSSSLKGSIYDYLSGVQGISGMTPAELQHRVHLACQAHLAHQQAQQCLVQVDTYTTAVIAS